MTLWEIYMDSAEGTLSTEMLSQLAYSKRFFFFFSDEPNSNNWILLQMEH